MMLGAPWLALILLCTLVPALLLLWILRLRRARVRVPAAWLWLEGTEDLRAEIPFKRLRWSVLLLLQCIALALLILAAARPRVTTNDGRGGRTVLLIDVSASMHTRDDPGGDRRFEQAIDAARAAVDRLHPGGLLDARDGRTMIIAVGAMPRVVQPFTASRQVLLGALQTMEPVDEPGNLAEALRLAQAWAAVPDPDVVEAVETSGDLRLELFSDGGLGDLDAALDTLQQTLVLHHVGSLDTANNAIALVGAERLRDDPAQLRPFVSLMHFGADGATVDVRLAIDGVPVAVRRVALPAGSESDGVFEPGRVDVLFPLVQASDEAIVQAQLVPGDGMPRDDVAWSIVPSAFGGRVQIAGSLSSVVLRAIGAIGLQVADAQADLLVGSFDAPATLPRLPSLTFGVPGASTMVRSVGSHGSDRVVDVDGRHPVMRGSGLSGLRIDQTVELAIEPGVRVLAHGTQGPLIVAWREAGVPRVHVAFRPDDSAWPYREDFITFLVDAEAWLSGRSDERTRVLAGDTIMAQLPADVDTVSIMFDGERLATLSPPDPSRTVWGPAQHAGIYTLQWSSPNASGEHRVAVGMPVVAEGNVRVAAPVRDVALVQVQRARRRSMPLWPFAVMAALLTLLVEWWVWTRRE